MNLYSYHYLTQNFSNLGLWLSIVTAAFVVAFIILGILYLRNRTNLKYRDFFVVLSFLAILFASLQVSNFMSMQSSSSQSGQTATVLKNISKQKNVPLSQVYSNSTTLQNGMTIKAGKQYYQVTFNNDQSGYSLTPTNLVYNQPTYVKANRFNFNFLNNVYVELALKLLIGFIMLVIQINLSGKGNLMPSNAIDQLQNYVLGGIIGGMIYNDAITILQFFIVLLIWSLIIFGSKLLVRQSDFFKRMLTGNPQKIISNGNIIVDNALKNGMSGSDLAFKLRLENIGSFQDVKSAVLEQNGQMTITSYGDESIKYPLITDGKVDESVLKRIDKDDQWVEDQVNKQNLTVEQVYLGQLIGGKFVLVPYPQHKHRFGDSIFKLRKSANK
ncbi:DUF3290 family protein [Lactobacillus sp. Sy-1]|uniref:DUF3290 family protein n=1 Tax=Lactobacillus sp. Sy-1 TaxID=2109645 RepID=UPI001C560A88|nr:DUF3290 family protein [Lactobacillus sp. Sy-1]MBW1605135.1 DUF3290 family protein [Lactobacillus sp. Sy-1]